MSERFCSICSRPLEDTIYDLCDECAREVNELLNMNDEFFQYHLKVVDVYEVPLYDIATLVADQNLIFYKGCLFFHFVLPAKTVEDGVFLIYEFINEAYFTKVGEYHHWVVLNDRTKQADYIDNISEYGDLHTGWIKPIRVVNVPDRVTRAVYAKIVERADD